VADLVDFNKGVEQAILWALDDAGEQRWRRADEGPDGTVMVVDLVAGRGAKKTDPGWLWRLDGAGNSGWRVAITGARGYARQGLAMRPDGSIAVTGATTGAKGRARCALTVVEPGGDIRWQRSYASSTAGFPGYGGYDGDDLCAALHARKDGSLTVVGTSVIYHLHPTLYRAHWQLRVDPWGHESCTAAGKCAALKAAACDDSDACSTDTCDPAKGCKNAENSASCDDGNKCTGAGKCKEGSCKPGAARLFEITYGDTLHNRPVRLVPLPGGGALSLENRANDMGWPDVVEAVQARRLAADGGESSVSDIRPVIAGQTWKYARIHDVDVLTDGSIVATGLAQNGGTHSGSGLLRSTVAWSFAPDGTYAGARAYGHTGTIHYFTSQIGCAGDDGMLLAVAHADNPRRTLAMRLDRHAKIARASVDIQPLLSRGYVDECAQSTAGDFIVAGHQDYSGKGGLFLQRMPITSDGSPIPATTSKEPLVTFGSGDGLSGADANGITSAVALLPRADGGALVVARTPNLGAGGWDAWLLRVDGKLKARWERAIGSADNELVLGATVAYEPGDRLSGGRVQDAADDADILLWGAKWATGKAKNGFVWRLDHRGRRLWERSWTGAKDAALADVSILRGGELLLAGTTQSKGKGGDDLWLLRANAWGHSTCTAAGGCIGKSAASCDDGNPCTADTCDPKSGCRHRAVPGACGERPSCTERFKKTDGTLDWVTPPSEQFDLVLDAKQADEVTDVGELGARVLMVGVLGDDSVIAAHDTAGSTIWRRQDKASKALRFEAVATSGRHAVVAGYTAAPEIAAAGGNDGVLMMVDARGRRLWRTSVGGDDDDRLLDLAYGETAGWVGAGRSRSKSAGGWDGWLVALDVSGKERWQLRRGGAKNDTLNGVVVLSGGAKILAAGATASLGKGGTDGWLVAVGADGKAGASATHGGAKDDSFAAIATRPDGADVVVVGTTLGSGGGNGWFARVTGSLGVVQSSGAAGHPQLSDEFRDVVLLPGGHAAAVGSRNSDGAKSEGWLVLFDSAGKVTREHIPSAPTDDTFTSIAALRRGGFAVGGTIVDGAKGTRGWLMRTNPWGFTDCKAAGKCAWSGPSLCDDGLPCTVDACDPKVGCTHTGDPSKCAPVINATGAVITNCAALKKASPSAKSGRYKAIPLTGRPDVTIYCDMETAGGGWTLFGALRADTPRTWHMTKWLNKHLEPDKLSLQGRGDVHTNGLLSRDTTAAIGHAGAMEYMVDTGAGLFIASFKKANHHGYKLDGFSPVYKPKAALEKPGANYPAMGIGLKYAPEAHTPAPAATWYTAALRTRQRTDCKPWYECAFLPGDAAGRFQQAHLLDGTPAAGFDGARRHPVRLYVR